jgi:hypothetical protein
MNINKNRNVEKAPNVVDTVVNVTAGGGICNSSACILYLPEHSLRHPRSVDAVGCEKSVFQHAFSNNDNGENEGYKIF